MHIANAVLWPNAVVPILDTMPASIARADRRVIWRTARDAAIAWWASAVPVDFPVTEGDPVPEDHYTEPTSGVLRIQADPYAQPAGVAALEWDNALILAPGQTKAGVVTVSWPHPFLDANRVGVLAHELGHALGLKHRFDAMGNLAGHTVMGDLGRPDAHDLASVTALYYGLGGDAHA